MARVALFGSAIAQAWPQAARFPIRDRSLAGADPNALRLEAYRELRRYARRGRDVGVRVSSSPTRLRLAAAADGGLTISDLGLADAWPGFAPGLEGVREREFEAGHRVVGEARGPIDWQSEIARHGRKVVVFLLARGVAMEQAKELAQEAWMRLIEKQRQGELESISLPGLVLRQAQYLAQDAQRKAQRRRELARAAGYDRACGDSLGAVTGRPEEVQALVEGWLGETEVPDMDRQIDARSRLRRVLRTVAQSSERSQAVFLRMHGPHARSGAAEIARELGLSVQRVRQIACEVRAEIRRALECEDDD